ncbi:MAG: hypothetical protein ACLGXA_21330 [Acidobacteriota bacterium]
MKIGLENKRNVIILAVLGLVLIPSIIYFVSSVFGGSPSPKPVQTAENGTPGGEGAAMQTEARDASGRPAKKLPPLEKLDPTLHPEWMAGAESLEYSGAGRNIFSMSSAPVNIPEVKGPVRPQAAQQEIAKGPTGPPPPPPIDLKFFGYASGGGTKRAFLLHGDDVFIANEGDVVDHHYKVVKISPLSIQVTDLLYNNTQTLPLTQS